ncbi:MAG: extracellular solute-binding protein [Bacilli bacterium]|nr:extracellular solute-binding protein [Bacilli bacterium]
MTEQVKERIKKITGGSVKIAILRLFGIFILFNLILTIISFFVKLDKESIEDNIYPEKLSMLNYDDSRNYQKVNIETILSVDLLTDNTEYGKKVYHWLNNEESKDLSFNVDVASSGMYEIALDYMSLQNDVQDITLSIKVDGEEIEEARNIILPTYWTDVSREEVYDIYQNEVNSMQERINVWNKYFLYDQRYYETLPLSFDLSSGNHEITIEKTNGEILLGDVYLFSKSEFDNYEKGNEVKNNNLIALEGESPAFRSSPNIQASSSQMVHLTPYSTSKNMLNTLSGDSFNESGYSVTYAFDVKESGYYKIALKYYISQTFTSVYSKVFVDNVILYDKLNRYIFKNNLNNRGTSYEYEVLNDNDSDILFYLEEGNHTLTFQIDASLQAPIYYELVKMIDEINELYLEVIKLTGGSNDKNKTWNIDLYIPTAKTRLNDWVERLENLLDYISEVSMSNPKKENRLYQQIKNAYKKIKDLAKDPNKLPSKLNILYEGSASASLMLSNSLHTSTFSPLSIDKIYIYGEDAKLPKIRNSFFKRYFATMQRIFRSKVDPKDKDAVTIWVNRSTYYVSMMQQFADAYYTPNSGVKVRLSLLPDESKLTYANASNTQPDAAIGVSSSIPYSLGIRGALADLRVMPGFNEAIKTITPGSLIGFMEGDKVYGLPETQDFQVLFYRHDILERLGLEVPNTYEDIIDMLPTLQRYGMNYYMPMAGGAGLKSIGTTAPFYYQYGCDIYSDDFLKAEIDTVEGIKAMTMMVDLFTIYSLPLTTQNFYNDFRNGLIPIGVANFDAYLQLKNAAPEIIGKWDITLCPGVEQEDGTINRTQTADNKTCVIFEKSNRQAEAWDFIKWWLSTDIQSRFASGIQATYGETFLWNTANIEAFKTLALPEKDKEVILKQWEYLYIVPQTPATYMIERGISNAWNACVFNNKSVRAAVTDYTLEINREITRKMIEFKYLDKDGNKLKEYKIPSLEEIKKWQQEG